ncbi:hypothetical protein COCC4DRAFT_65272 [Bipolaris maydis ATCC 48331]|uniref:Uncharacterized protein n=2 Tax=Cochliobolus heterostrophus TaxID=5016 RepID=M2VA69_COCH5|nr:uncharacterized protein COCC4DRAFT_65272 [Bipolaris maydis ATCC 48331]EMD96618.1 hypothetical protein COCHEDRAFT_1199526 [Bipolaris maydis C5]KAH7558402.1 hypothetical protein BM1_05674 [Bipolaris maydis]ENI00558.1 hypothetical protein COCC4DRAFT_65272 [Bipolaris maydis ATCC 48331]KAJ5031499.1 hypothetical protein J3E73DRAFT_267595 [Bipolaris maydis]KAJ5060457.1 hypothetical protein J3E74DRAFT_344491 [Bipolaris maydis]
MLLTTSFFSHQMAHCSPYTPPRSSPLSERSGNVQPQIFDFTMSSPIKEQSATSQRAFKSNPVMQTRDAATKRRRDMFFKRVQNNREDKKWESRGEQIQQLDFVTERKRWEAEKARQAPPVNDDIIEEPSEDAQLPNMFNNAPQFDSDMTEADYIAAQEEYELQQLIASIEQEPDVQPHHYGSDDEDYDSIFMECAMAEDGQSEQPSQTVQNGFGREDMMDTDMMDF